MRASRVSGEKQYQLIMECRSSGLSDYQWCMEHDIKPGTFYNWVKRLRKSGCQDIPAAARNRNHVPSVRQEVVKVNFDVVPEVITQTPPQESVVPDAQPVMEIVLGNATLRISNGISSDLLHQTFALIREMSC
jgi:transposase-like protein